MTQDFEDSTIMSEADNRVSKLQDGVSNLGQSELEITDTAAENDSAIMSSNQNSKSMFLHIGSQTQQPILDIASLELADTTLLPLRNNNNVQNGKLKLRQPELDFATLELNEFPPTSERYSNDLIKNGGLKFRQPALKVTMNQDNFTTSSAKYNDEIKVNPEQCELQVAVADGNKTHVMDGGWAWMVLLGGALNHVIADGIISVLSIFILVWKEQFPGSISALSWIPSLNFGIAYAAGKDLHINILKS